MDVPVTAASAPAAASSGDQAQATTVAGQAAPSSPEQLLASATPVDQPLARLQLASPGLAGWPDSLLLLIIEHLPLRDLVRCSRVCRQWHRVAGDTERQARAFLHSYGAGQRQSLQQILEASPAARQDLLRFHEALPTDSPLRTVCASHGAQELSAAGLFYRLTQQRICATCFTAPGWFDLLCGAAQMVVWSPDTLTLATVTGRDSITRIYSNARHALEAATGAESGTRGLLIRLWRRNAQNLERVGQYEHPVPLTALFFTADSRSLQAIDNQGRSQTWQRPSGVGGDQWTATGIDTFCEGIVWSLQPSADGRYLAICAAGSLQILAARHSGGWQPLCSVPWRTLPGEPAQGAGFGHAPRLVLFAGPGAEAGADRGQHLLLADSLGLWPFEQKAGLWYEQSVSARCGVCLPDRDSLLEATIDPQGQWLATATWRGWTEGTGVNGRIAIGLWQFQQGRGWQHEFEYHCQALGMQRRQPFVMAFRPDGCQLAFPDRSEQRNLLCVLQRQSGHWSLDSRLHFEPCSQKTAVSGVVGSLEYSTNGRYLVAAADGGVRVVQYDAAAAGWTRGLWIPQKTGELVQVSLSPDGYHCALTCGGAGGRVDLWGPDGAGNYARKFSWQSQGLLVDTRFSADASRLLVFPLLCFTETARRSPAAAASGDAASEPPFSLVPATDRTTPCRVLSGMKCCPLVLSLPQAVTAPASQDGDPASVPAAEP